MQNFQDFMMLKMEISKMHDKKQGNKKSIDEIKKLLLNTNIKNI